MTKKFIAAAALVLILVPLSAGAQTAANMGFQALSFDVGYAPGWDLNNNDLVTPALFGFNVWVADGFSAGFQQMVTGGAIHSSFLMLKGNLLPGIRATLGFGSINGIAGGASSFGFEVIPFSRSGGMATSEFKIAVKYDSPFADITNGRVYFALAFGVGF
ncbi:MAG: hypothetical protein LBL56_03865 [Treponema sp.]|jgi:hypothetical protein|nr:hypothetical protein [Treponema sp.]